MKFRAGDKVKYKDEEIETCNAQKIFIVKKVSLYHNDCLVCDINDPSKTYIIDGDYLELADNNVKYKKPTKDELFNMPKGTKIYTNANNDNEFIYDGNRFNSLNKFLYKSNISEALKIVNIALEFSTDFGTQITKIEVPTDYEIIYDITEKNMESLREENERLIRQVAELKEKLNEKNNQDIKVSKQELDIMNYFFERR